MTDWERDFYLAVATVIPVFAVAYAISVSRTLGQSFLRYSQSMDLWTRRVAAAFRSSERRTTNLAHAARAFLRAMAFNQAFGVLIIAAVALPGSAEVLSLHALYAGGASSSVRTLCLVGALAAGAVVIGPLLLAILPRRFSNDRLVRQIYDRWQRGDLTADVWARGAMPRVVGLQRTPPTTRRLYFAAWKNSYFDVEKCLAVDAERVLVLRTVLGNQSATQEIRAKLGDEGADLFQLWAGRVTKLDLYRDRAEALKAAGLSKV